MKSFKYNLTLDELKKRTSKEYFIIKKFLDENSSEYLSLNNNDKIALKHLVKAATYIDDVNLKLDNKYNIEIREWLNNEIAKGSEQAKLTKILFDGQKGVNAIDNFSNYVELIKGIKTYPGKGYYPEDLTADEFHSILMSMLKEGFIDEVKKILTQRSVVVREGKYLKGIDYVECFNEEFANVVIELEEAIKYSTNNNFNEYLKLQVEALKIADPMLDALADKKWATLEDTPLEFTITRESYVDEMTTTIMENYELSKMLEMKGVEIITKDAIGCRVGIINKEGTKFLSKIKKHIPVLANLMPFANEYKQEIVNNDNAKQKNGRC